MLTDIRGREATAITPVRGIYRTLVLGIVDDLSTMASTI